MEVGKIVESIRPYYLMCKYDYMTGVILQEVQPKEWEVILHLYTMCQNAFYSHVQLIRTNKKLYLKKKPITILLSIMVSLLSPVLEMQP